MRSFLGDGDTLTAFSLWPKSVNMDAGACNFVPHWRNGPVFIGQV
jgi:hypothetical protein